MGLINYFHGWGITGLSVLNTHVMHQHRFGWRAAEPRRGAQLASTEIGDGQCESRAIGGSRRRRFYLGSLAAVPALSAIC